MTTRTQHFKQFRIEYDRPPDHLDRTTLLTDINTQQQWMYHACQYQELLKDIGFEWGKDMFKEG